MSVAASNAAPARPRQAVLLAAGRGSRAGALCAQRPKALLPLAGRSLLERSVEALCAVGIERLCLVGGWQLEALQAFVEVQAPVLRARGFALELIEQPRWAETGPVGSLCAAEPLLLAAPTLVLYGDCAYAAAPLETVLAAYAGGLCVPGDRQWAALWSQRFAAPLEDAERWRSARGRLLDIGGRAESLDRESAQFMGLCLIDPTVWHALRACAAPAEFERLDFTRLFAAALLQGQRIDCVEVDGGWLEVDSAADLSLYEQLMHAHGAAHGVQA